MLKYRVGFAFPRKADRSLKISDRRAAEKMQKAGTVGTVR